MTQVNGTASGQPGAQRVDAPEERAYQQLWFALARSTWSSLVVVPADPGGSADQVARALADVGKRLSSRPVTAVTAGALEYGTALALADLPQFVDQRRQLQPSAWPTVEVPASTAAEDPPASGADHAAGGPQESMVVSSGARIIISIPAVVSEPLGLATTMSADAVVICVEMGMTRMADVRRTVELVGRERVAGCFLIR